MKTKTLHLIVILFITTSALFAQQATIRGVLLDKANYPIAGANVTFGTEGVLTDLNGYYLLEIPSNKNVVIIYSFVGYKNTQLTISLKPNADFEFNPVMDVSVEQIGIVELSAKRNKRVTGIVTISPEAIRKIPGANAGVENLLKSLPGVNGNNELSTQYAVRGGNYDENLVYVNEIEVYRPFLIRSGQQEGLSFVNTDLTSNVDFSAGGFQAKYGDKLSSVLDITYRKPTNLGASLDLSLLGASASVEGISNDGKLTAIVGLRYRNNSLFVNSKQTETNFRPVFA
ncbi:MAG: hypothetical protein ACI840_002314, partial [Ulvibacter sp.]